MYLSPQEKLDFKNWIKEYVQLYVEEYMKKAAERAMDEKWVSQSQACKILDITRQTFTNWKNGKDTREKIAPNIRKLGRRVLVNTEGILRTTKSNDHLFTQFNNKNEVWKTSIPDFEDD